MEEGRRKEGERMKKEEGMRKKEEEAVDCSLDSTHLKSH